MDIEGSGGGVTKGIFMMLNIDCCCEWCLEEEEDLAILPNLVVLFCGEPDFGSCGSNKGERQKE